MGQQQRAGSPEIVGGVRGDAIEIVLNSPYALCVSRYLGCLTSALKTSDMVGSRIGQYRR